MNLIKLIKVLWAGKGIILVFMLLGAILSICLSLYLPNIYQATVTVIPVEEDKGQRFSGLSDSITSFSGLNIADKSVSEVDLILEILQSRRFILSFIEEHKIKIPLMAVTEWEQKSGELIYDSNVYNIERNEWNLEELVDNKIPSDEKVYNEFRENLSVVTDPVTRIIRISYKSPSPRIARQWVTWLIEDINDFKRKQDIEKADISIEYLNNQISETNITEVRNIFFELVKEQHKIRLLANTREEYSFAVIDPAIESEFEISPKRILICVFGTLLFSALGMITVYVRYVLGRDDFKYES